MTAIGHVATQEEDISTRRKEGGEPIAFSLAIEPAP
jgi:hypothetical protein